MRQYHRNEHMESETHILQKQGNEISCISNWRKLSSDKTTHEYKESCKERKYKETVSSYIKQN